MRAAKDQRVGIEAARGGFGAELIEIDVDDLGGDWVAGPSLFDQWDEQRTGFLDGAEAEGLAGAEIGVALDGGVGGDDEDVAGFRGSAGGGGAGLDDSENGDGNGVLDGVEGQCAGGVAGDDEEFGALFADQKLRALGGVAGDGAAGLGAVGQAGGVAEEREAGLRQAGDERAEDGESAEAGVENTDGGDAEDGESRGWSWMNSFRGDGVGGEVGAGEVGVAGEGCAGQAVDQEADLGDSGQIGVERGADGENGEGFGLKT